MIKISKNYSIILLIFVFLILGCTPTTSKDKQIDIYVGTEGIIAEFAKTAPPQRVLEETNFPILLRLTNKGAYSITKEKQGVITIGRERDYIPFLKKEITKQGEAENEIFFEINGKSQINPKGDEIFLPIVGTTGKLDPQSEQKESTITANLCYPYKTILSTTVCIDTDVAGIRPAKKVCTVKDMLFNNGQGAPVAVTKIESQMVPEGDFVKPQFLIFVENKGNGNPVNPGNYKSICGRQDVGDDLWNAAFVKAASGNKELECTPGLTDKTTGFLKFRDRKDFVRCTFKEGISKNFDAFASPLSIEIDYGYVQTISANFIIQKPAR